MCGKLKISRVALYVLVALCTFSVGIAAFAYWWLNYSHHPSPETFKAKVAEYNQLIQREIPEGSNLAQVQAFLNAHKIKHSDYTNNPETESAFEQLEFPNKRQVIKGYILAIVRNVEYESLIEWSIQPRFYFDKQDKLVAHTVDWVGTGP